MGVAVFIVVDQPSRDFSTEVNVRGGDLHVGNDAGERAKGAESSRCLLRIFGSALLDGDGASGSRRRNLIGSSAAGAALF
jgi:hypothetical protein